MYYDYICVQTMWYEIWFPWCFKAYCVAIYLYIWRLRGLEACHRNGAIIAPFSWGPSPTLKNIHTAQQISRHQSNISDIGFLLSFKELLASDTFIRFHERSPSPGDVHPIATLKHQKWQLLPSSPSWYQLHRSSHPGRRHPQSSPAAQRDPSRSQPLLPSWYKW